MNDELYAFFYLRFIQTRRIGRVKKEFTDSEVALAVLPESVLKLHLLLNLALIP